MRVDESPITLREIEKRASRTGPKERELLLLLGISFATMWATIFLLHRSTTLVFAYSDNIACRDVANAILHWRNIRRRSFNCGFYLSAIFSCDYLIWARRNFIRFCIPALPFVFFALLPVLPKNRWRLWGLCIVSGALAAASAIGVRNVVRGFY